MKAKASILLKLISLLVALGLWIIIMNTINPLVNGYVNLPISITNENYVTEQNKAYTIHGSRIVKVTYSVKTDYQTNIRQNDFKAYIDLSDLSYTNDLPIRYEVLDDVDMYISNVQIEPKKMHVEIVDALRSEFNIKYDLKGETGPEHSVGNVILSPSIIYVSGSDEAIKNIDHISIEIPIRRDDETFSGTAKPKLYAKDGTAISMSGLTLSADEISYSVVMYSRVNVTLNAIVEGNVGGGYSYAGVQINPNAIMINGPRSVIQNLYTIDLPVINIEGLTGNKEFTYQVSDILPIGITSNVQTVTAKVTVNDNILNRAAIDQVNVGPHNEKLETEETSESSMAESGE